jgi:uncharacterized membrane protein YphA (DoxX/SURF4 family)
MSRRLYTPFPNGTAGIGLLLLRLLSGGCLADQSQRVLCGLFATPESKGGTLGEIAAASVLVASILILVGLWTSIAASVAPAAALTVAGLGFVHSDTLLWAALSIVIALLGPGALSLDARLFGWQQIRFPRIGARRPGEP